MRWSQQHERSAQRTGGVKKGQGMEVILASESPSHTQGNPPHKRPSQMTMNLPNIHTAVIDQRDHKPTTIEFTNHAARRIAHVDTPPSRDASPTPNMYHPL
jgi:hypothetical protein